MRTKEKNSIVANSINIKKEKKRKQWRFFFVIIAAHPKRLEIKKHKEIKDIYKL